MKSFREPAYLYSLCFLTVFMFLFVSCKHAKTNKIPIQSSVKIENTDSTYLFNGQNLDGWEITNFGPQGPVNISGGSIVLGMGEGCTGITWKKYFPVINYELSLDAKRVAGTDFFCGVTFPVSDSHISLIVGGWGGSTVGLSCIDGKDAAENETTLIMHFDNNRWYHIRLKVTAKSIESWIDSTRVVNFMTGKNNLSIRPEVTLSQPFGIASWYTTAALKNIRLHQIEK